MRQFLAIAAAAALVTVVVASMTAPTGESRTVSCEPAIANSPQVNPDRTGRGWGTFLCDASDSYAWNVRLINGAGSILIQNSGNDVGQSQHSTAEVSCAGAWVRSFAYRNWNGNGSSDTSSSEFC